MTNQLQHQRPIGIFDSGAGGLTVFKEIERRLPGENLVYFGDTARLPYGEKSPETIIRYSMENAAFLMGQDIKCLVVACNTASVYALEKLKQTCHIPVIGVIEAGVDSVIKATKSGRIGIIGTRGTVSSGVYQREIPKKFPGASVMAIPCPLLVPLIEERMAHHSVTSQILEGYLAPLKAADIDTLLLACTHYPILKKTIQQIMGDEVKVIDSATTCAALTDQVLIEQNLKAADSTPGSHIFYVSDDPEKFQNIGSLFLGGPLKQVESVLNR